MPGPSANGHTISAGDTILFNKGQTFSGALNVQTTGTAGNIVTFDAYGSGANPILTTATTHGVYFYGMNYLTFNNLRIQGATSQGFYFYNSNSHISVSNCTVAAAVGAYGAEFGTGNFSYISFSNVNFSGMKRGISIGTVTSLDHLSITDSVFNTNSQYGFLGLAAIAATNTTISGSTFNGTTAGSGFDMTLGDNLNITSSQFNSNVGASSYGMILRGYTNISLTSVTATGNGNTNIDIIASGATLPRNVAIASSTANSSAAGAGIYVSKANILGISSTTASNNATRGLDLEGCTNVTITNPTLSNNGSDGFYESDIGGVSAGSTTMTGGTISNNSPSSRSYNGLSLAGSGSGFTATGVTVSGNGGDGYNIHGTWSEVVFNNCISDTNGTDGTGSDGDGFSFHETTSGIIENSISRNNKKSAVANVANATVDMRNNLFYHSTNGTIGLIYLSDTGTYTIYNNTIYSGSHTGEAVRLDSSGGNVAFKNNIISGFDYGIRKVGAITNLSEDYNLVYGANTSYSGISAGTHDISANPQFTSPTTDFSLLSTSPAIDAGTNVGLTSDYLGNPIYGSPDIGAYEYQPTYVTNTNSIDASAGARIYANGKFRNLGTASGSSADLVITPQSGSFTAGDYSAWMDITNLTWSNTATHHKAWTETSSVSGLANTLHTVGNLDSNTFYTVKIDNNTAAPYITGTDCTEGICKSDDRGRITFTFTGTYSSHTFDVEQRILQVLPDTGIHQIFFNKLFDIF